MSYPQSYKHTNTNIKHSSRPSRDIALHTVRAGMTPLCQRIYIAVTTDCGPFRSPRPCRHRDWILNLQESFPSSFSLGLCFPPRFIPKDASNFLEAARAFRISLCSKFDSIPVLVQILSKQPEGKSLQRKSSATCFDTASSHSIWPGSRQMG